ncbi:heme-binding protein [Uliginosibacterium sp. 31-16]|uniref:heme-binding protein n=1 Tax=Uliginosibacterium sp. 31-16 TaxID=3068315 RepID=UPI00353200FC
MSNPLPPRYGAPITLAEAKRVMAAAEAECAKQGDWPMVIAIVDGSANLVMLRRRWTMPSTPVWKLLRSRPRPPHDSVARPRCSRMR